MEKRGGLWLGSQLLKLVKEREVRKREWSLTRVVFGQVAYCGPSCCPITLVSVGPVYSGIFFRAETWGQVTQVIHQFLLYVWCWPVIAICVATFSWVPVELKI